MIRCSAPSCARQSCFEAPITNFNANDDFTWVIEAFTPQNALAELDQSTGLVTVTNVAPGAEASVTVTATQQGVFVQGRSTKTASASNEARTPQFGGTTRTADGFTVQISNYSDQFTWAGTATQSGRVAINGSGRVTVTGVAPDTESVATITTQRDGFVAGSNTVSDAALKVAKTPQFTSPIKNPGRAHGSDHELRPGVRLAPNASNTNDTPEIDGTGLGQRHRSDPGHLVAPPSHDQSQWSRQRAGRGGRNLGGWTSIAAGLGPATSTAVGFTVPIQNKMSRITWVARTDSGTAIISGQGVLVTGLAPGQAATVTVTASRSGYADGSASARGSALTAAAADTTKATVPAAPTISRIDAKKKGKARVYYTPGATAGLPSSAQPRPASQ